MNTPAAGAARPPRGAPPPFRDDGAVTLAWLRRLDWRFLLPPREPRRVAYLGPERDSLLLALGEHGPTPRVVRRGGLAGRGCFDLVVAQSPGPDDLERAAALVADGGSLYCELPRRGRATLLRRVRDLGAAGFGAPALYWHHPGFEDAIDRLATYLARDDEDDPED